MKKLNFFVLLLLNCFALKGQLPGSLDSTFGVSGKVVTNITGIDDRIQSILIQADGKIVAGGATKLGTKYDFCLVRYNDNGNLDNAFGVNGVAITDVGNDDDIIRNIKLQPDGKIITAGETYNGTDYDFVLARYDSLGLLDSTFGVNGIQITNTFNGDDYTGTIVLDASGRIYLYGQNTSEGIVARYTSNGILDTAFSNAGIAYINLTGGHFSSAMAVQTEKEFVCTGRFLNDFMLFRLDTTGIIDTLFGNNGFAITNIGSSLEQINSICILNDSAIIVGGGYDPSNTGANWDYVLAKYNIDGIIDSTFGNNGTVITQLSNSRDILCEIKLQPDGKIIAAGYTGATPNFALARYNENGSLDLAFGNNGIVVTDFAFNYDVAYTMAIANDYKILAAGATFDGSQWSFALARYFSGLNVGVVDFEKQPLPVQAYPNPVKNYATLTYALPKDESITIKLFDIMGKEIKIFMEGNKKMKGEHTEYLYFDESIKAGVYFLIIGNGDGVLSVKVVKN